MISVRFISRRFIGQTAVRKDTNKAGVIRRFEPLEVSGWVADEVPPPLEPVAVSGLRWWTMFWTAAAWAISGSEVCGCRAGFRVAAAPSVALAQRLCSASPTKGVIQVAQRSRLGVSCRMIQFFRRIEILAVLSLGVLVVPAGATPIGREIGFSSLDKHHPLKVSGTLYLPENSSGPSPAVVVVHGTMGIDSRGAFYRESILQAGIAIFEVDFRTGIYSGALDRPSPDALLPMGFAALKELRKLPAIDPDRIGIMGFSMGGHLTVYTAFEKNRRLWMGDEKGFAAHAAFYPVCKVFLTQSDCRVTGAPMIIFYGTKDAYGDGDNVPAFKRLLWEKEKFEVTTVEYAGAYHGFNRNAPAQSYRDPAAKGWKGYMAWDANAANDSLARVVDFLRRTLAVR